LNPLKGSNPGIKRITIARSVLVDNKLQAAKNKEFFDKQNSLVINIIASPGAGKTTLIQQVVENLKKDYSILVIEGDIKGEIDARQIQRLSVDVIQINTVTRCHLDAFMVGKALTKISKVKNYDLVLIENVGNLVCPAEFEVGEDFKMAVLSTPEGDDKPLKYPLIFHLARVVVINKYDLLPYVDFDIKRAKKHILQKNPRAAIFGVSAKTGEGFEKFITFLTRNLANKKRKKGVRSSLYLKNSFSILSIVF